MTTSGPLHVLLLCLGCWDLSPNTHTHTHTHTLIHTLDFYQCYPYSSSRSQAYHFLWDALLNFLQPSFLSFSPQHLFCTCLVLYPPVYWSTLQFIAQTHQDYFMPGSFLQTCILGQSLAQSYCSINICCLNEWTNRTHNLVLEEPLLMFVFL